MCLENLGIHTPLPLEWDHKSTAQASLEVAKANKEGKETLKGPSPYHLSFQNFTLLPFPTKKEILQLTIFHKFLMAFHSPTP